MFMGAAISIVALGALAQTSAAKGELRAVLVQPVPVDAKPGTTIAVDWKLQTKRGDQFVPFGAGQIYFRLVGREPGHVSEAIVDGTGTFSARLKVPPIGIERVETGIVGMRMEKGREATRSDYPITIVGPSLEHSNTAVTTSTRGIPAEWLGAAGIFALLMLAAYFLRHRRASVETAAQ